MVAIETRLLIVYFENHVIGNLQEYNNIWQFTYHESWLTIPLGFDISPHLSRQTQPHIDGANERHVQWFFDNLLPEEDARTLLARDAAITKDDVFGLLEYYGAESAGALTLLPVGKINPAGTFDELSLAVLSERIKKLPKVSLNKGAKKRMSLAGAQHKLAVVYHQGQLYEPSGSAPSSHILKPDPPKPDEYWQSTRNEWFVMSLAKSLGFNVPAVDLIYVPEPVYLVERFDRENTWPDQSRLHMLDACQLLALDKAFKYKSSNVESLCILNNHCRNKAKTRMQLYNWAVFNAIVGNTDAHLKNLSFFMTNDTITLTPHYDLLSTAIYADSNRLFDDELSQPMGEAKTLGQLTVKDVVLFGESLGLKEKQCLKQLKALLSSIEEKAIILYSEVEALPINNYKAGELRMLREIIHIIIKEMVKKLS
jgi:serine/threonine-protein kinase HipA